MWDFNHRQNLLAGEATFNKRKATLSLEADGVLGPTCPQGGHRVREGFSENLEFL